MTDIENIDKNTLADIRDISTDTTRPINTRIIEIFEILRNPYCFLVEGAAVKISFSETGKTLDEAVTDHFTGIKRR